MLLQHVWLHLFWCMLCILLIQIPWPADKSLTLSRRPQNGLGESRSESVISVSSRSSKVTFLLLAFFSLCFLFPAIKRCVHASFSRFKSHYMSHHIYFPFFFFFLNHIVLCCAACLYPICVGFSRILCLGEGKKKERFGGKRIPLRSGC